MASYTHKNLSQSKAKEILRHGEVHSKPISEKQKGFFGVIAGGKVPRKLKREMQAKALERK